LEINIFLPKDINKLPSKMPMADMLEEFFDLFERKSFVVIIFHP
jgi:hypothetical protein